MLGSRDTGYDYVSFFDTGGLWALHEAVGGVAEQEHVHALLQDDGVARGAGRPAAASSPHYVRRSFAWSEQAHPLAQGVDAAAPSGLVRYASPAAGALRSLVADQGRVVFPGSGYLEMARAASDAAAVAAAARRAGTKLRGAFKVQFLCAQRGAGVLLNISAKFWRISSPD